MIVTLCLSALCVHSIFIFILGFVCAGFYLKQKLRKSSDTEMDTINTTPQVIQKVLVYEAVSPTNQEYHVQLHENVAYGLSQTTEKNYC